MFRVVLGFVVAPAAPVLVALLLSPRADGIFVVLLASYALTLLIGLPVFLVFRWLGWLALWQVLSGGAVCIAAVVLLYVGGAGWGSPHLNAYGVHNSLFLAAFTETVVATFWLVAIWRNSGARRVR